MRTCIILALALPLIAFAYTSPGAPVGLVNDFAGMLDPAERLELETNLQQFEQQTSNEIAIVTISDLGGDTIENYAVALFEEWGIGKKNQDNGILVLVARDDREMRIEAGYGLEGALTDAQAFWIIDNVMKPAFREEKYYEGVKAAAAKIQDAIRGEYVPSAAPADARKFSFFDVIWLVFFPFLWLAAILGRSKSWWLGGVIGAAIALALTLFVGFLYGGLIAFAILVPFGLWFDRAVSRAYQRGKMSGRIPWWIGGGRRGSGRGGFGGFGGGSSGGGGASGRW